MNERPRTLLIVVLACWGWMVPGCGDTDLPIADAGVTADGPGPDSGEDAPSPAEVGPDAPGDAPSPAEVAPDAPTSLAMLCTSTGGLVQSTACCQTVLDFPDLCAPGACSCAPENSRMVLTCVCPAPTCFVQALGCARPSACTPGQDQSCNDSASVSSIKGKCNPDRTCTCNPGATLNPATGKCR